MPKRYRQLRMKDLPKVYVSFGTNCLFVLIAIILLFVSPWTTCSGVARAWRLGAKYERCNCDLEIGVGRVGVTASAEGAKLRLSKARNPSQLGGLGSVVSSPSGVWGGAQETNAILNISCQMECILGSY